MKNKKTRKLLAIILGSLLMVTAIVLCCVKLYRVKNARQSGILLAFDDSAEENWRNHFDFFDKYGVRVTFFMCLEEPTPFCHEALERGHDIGFHTVGHLRVTTMSEEEIQKRVIEPIELFRKEGIELTSFAYPYGEHTPQLDEKLLKYYKVVRGAYFYKVYGKADLRKGYVEAYPIDNYYLGDDEKFKLEIDGILEELSENVGAVTCLYSHTIDGGDWCVTQEHLEYLFQRANELGLRFYTFRELQD